MFWPSHALAATAEQDTGTDRRSLCQMLQPFLDHRSNDADAVFLRCEYSHDSLHIRWRCFGQIFEQPNLASEIGRFVPFDKDKVVLGIEAVHRHMQCNGFLQVCAAETLARSDQNHIRADPKEAIGVLPFAIHVQAMHIVLDNSNLEFTAGKMAHQFHQERGLPGATPAANAERAKF